jgi:uncharacterized cupin superfamily protein
MFIQQDIPSLPLNKRNLQDSAIVAGNPDVQGRIISLTDDKCTARVAWKMTAGTVKMSIDVGTSDLMYVLAGGAEIRVQGQPPIVFKAGDWVECPCCEFELHVPEFFHKISVIYNPNGLSLQAEPL